MDSIVMKPVPVLIEMNAQTTKPIATKTLFAQIRMEASSVVATKGTLVTASLAYMVSVLI